MSVNESEKNRICIKCIQDYQRCTGIQVFDYQRCLHCKISQNIHEADSTKWNGYCRFLR